MSRTEHFAAGAQWADPHEVSMVPVRDVGHYEAGDSRTGGPVHAQARRKRRGGDYQELREDIRAHGIKEPLIASSDAQIEGEPPVLIEGHTRWAAARELGLTHVPVRHW